MKIELNLNIPEGWKYVKYDFPKKNEYFLNNNSEVYQATSNHLWMKAFILEKVHKLKKYSFIETEEFRPLESGEGYRNSDNNEFCIWESSHKSLGCFLIYKVVIEDV